MHRSTYGQASRTGHRRRRLHPSGRRGSWSWRPPVRLPGAPVPPAVVRPLSCSPTSSTATSTTAPPWPSAPRVPSSSPAARPAPASASASGAPPRRLPAGIPAGSPARDRVHEPGHPSGNVPFRGLVAGAPWAGGPFVRLPWSRRRVPVGVPPVWPWWWVVSCLLYGDVVGRRHSYPNLGDMRKRVQLLTSEIVIGDSRRQGEPVE